MNILNINGLTLMVFAERLIHINKINELNIEKLNTFSEYGLDHRLTKSIASNGFEKPTEIQALTIPVILEGKDLFAQAETGSGKTGSFAIPVLEKILREDKSDIYIVLSPTRELAQQTHKVFKEFGDPLGVKSACVIGGESFQKQKDSISNGSRVIVGTPGRICDLIKQKVIKAKECNCVIFDEADRLFEMGFSKDNEFVLRSALPTRQIIMVSATNNQELLRTAYKFKSNPVEIKLNVDSLTVDSIDQNIVMLGDDEKMPFLVNLLRKDENAYAIIFCNTQYMTALVATWLKLMSFKVKAISGKLPQSKRTQLLQDFRDRKITILVCTDVAARGLDIKDVNLVINYDLPFEPANYVHRIGRTGRTGKDGLAIGFCGFEDSENLDAIKDYIGMSIPRMKLTNDDFATDLVKKPRINSKTLRPFENKKEKVQKKEKPFKRIEAQVENKTKAKSKSNEKIEDKREIKQFDRFFEVIDQSFKSAEAKALSFFCINETSILTHEVLSIGKKKFWFFGPQENKYRFKVEPVFRKTLLPFLIKLFRKMGLRIYVDVSFRQPQVSVTFSGDDAGLLKKNKFELHNAVVEIAKNYMRNKISMSSDIKFLYRTELSNKPVQKNVNKKNTKSNFIKNKQHDRSENTRFLSDEQLIEIAEDLKAMSVQRKQSAKSKKLHPAQRRIIHQHIQKDSKYKSDSIGDGKFKQIEITFIGKK
jgi:ATP-dependent RNA helicase RhlE